MSTINFNAEAVEPSVPFEAIPAGKYTAIITDSGGFCYSSVTPHTHEAAARLLAYGLDNERICYEQLRKQELRVLKMRTEAYSKAVYEFDNRVAIVVFSLVSLLHTDIKMKNTEKKKLIE